MAEYIEKPDMQYILHIKSDKKVEKRLIDYCLESVVDVFEDTGLTADVQPIVYAHKTINVGRRSYCSNCGKLAIMEDFCSKCGAKVKDGEPTRNLTDEETEIYESWIESEAKDTGVNIMDGEQNENN